MFEKSILNEMLIVFGEMLLIFIGLCTILFILFKALEMFIKEIIRTEINKTINKKGIVEFYKDGKLIEMAEIKDGVAELKNPLPIGEYIIKKYN